MNKEAKYSYLWRLRVAFSNSDVELAKHSTNWQYILDQMAYLIDSREGLGSMLYVWWTLFDSCQSYEPAFLWLHNQ